MNRIGMCFRFFKTLPTSSRGGEGSIGRRGGGEMVLGGDVWWREVVVVVIICLVDIHITPICAHHVRMTSNIIRRHHIHYEIICISHDCSIGVEVGGYVLIRRSILLPNGCPGRQWCWHRRREQYRRCRCHPHGGWSGVVWIPCCLSPMLLLLL